MAIEDKIDTVVIGALVAVIGIILLCSMVIPIAVDQIASLTGDASQYSTLIGVVIIVCVVGVIVTVLKSYVVGRDGGASGKR